MKKRIMLVFGTRPEAIKMAPLVQELKKETKSFEIKVCVTAQHREMLDQVLNLFEIVPDFDLDLMKEGQDLYDVTSRVILGMREVFKSYRPDIVLVHGDTTTSTATALAAFYEKIQIGHVEAGLRTHNLYSPWPEEANRQLTSRLASLHFAPTKLSASNLLNEGVSKEKIFVTGNTVIDALHNVLTTIKKDNTLKNEIFFKLKESGLPEEIIDVFVKDSDKKIVLITGHRRENFGTGFENICLALKRLTKKFPDVQFIYPMHLNPNVRKPIKKIFNNGLIDNIFFVEPLEYLPFVYLMSKSTIVLTDSGGIQEEAPGIGKPVLVMRDTTERPEAVTAGTVKLVGTEEDNIFDELSELLINRELYNKMSKSNNPYGDGKSCSYIKDVLLAL